MKIIHAAQELRPAERKICVAIGFFDGVHLGHQQIIRQTIQDARQHEAISLALTFDRHPNIVVAPERVPPLIYSLPQKLRAIELLGVDALLLIHFDRDFSLQTGESFIRSLAAGLGQIQSLCVGANFVFGHKRGGNVEVLKRLGTELKFTVHGLAAVALDGQAVSSTRIRQAIQGGDLDGASQMLGRAYSIAGPVVEGDGLGRQLGFPTANLEVSGLALPPNGVYAVHAEVRGAGREVEESPKSKVQSPNSRKGEGIHRGVLNVGWRPTVQNPTPQLRVEAHLLDYSGDLYGREMEVTFVDKLRDERRFGSLAELSEQIGKDILLAQTRF